MKHWRTILPVMIVAAVLTPFGTSCVQAQEPAGVTTRPADQQRRQELIKRFDKDGDGKLNDKEKEAAREEWQKRQKRDGKEAAKKVPAGVKAMRDVEYARVDGKPLLLDLYLPTEAPKPMPVIVYIHGGAWRTGSKDGCPALHLTSQGFAAISINYRLTDKATFPAQIFDCKGAIRWVRAHAKEYGFDPDHIGVWGSSAGGHLVALLGTSGGVKELEGEVGGNLKYSSRVQAVADFCGPSSLRIQDLEGLEGAKPGKTPPAVAALLGGTLEEKADLARLASPVAHVTPDDPPFFIAHGEKDNVVPVLQARILAAALKKADVEVTLHIDPEAGHGVGKPDTVKLAEEFFEKQLRGKASQSPATSTSRGS